MARELCALLGKHFSHPSFDCSERGAPVEQTVRVEIGATQQCPRYACRAIDGVTIAPSPKWLQARLEQCGVRSINNVVDVTNLVLLELGHPLHAFDIGKLNKDDDGRITVRARMANDKEVLETLDGEERELTAQDLVIADGKVPIALAGVMGGAGSEVSDGTTHIFWKQPIFNRRR